MPRRQVALVAGVSGIVGYRLAQSLAETQKWDVIGVSRKRAPGAAAFEFFPVDLTDIDDCRSKISRLTRVTHLFYAAKYSFPTERAKSDRALIDVNLAMLANLLNALEKKASSLKHVHVVHGTGYYGDSLGGRKTPFKEDDPRRLNDTVYYAQQDFIAERQRSKRWA